MGVFDAAGAAITGRLDGLEMRGIHDDLELRVKAMAPQVQIEGDGVIVRRHWHDVKGELLKLLDEMMEHIEAFEAIHVAVLEAL